MPSVLLAETSPVDLQSMEAWPDDAQLFQPYIAEQLLLPELANVTAVQAYLKMCGLSFTTCQRANAEWMSPGGLPFLKVGQHIVADFDTIAQFLSARGHSPADQLDQAQRADMKAYMSLVNTVLHSAESYLTWLNEDNYNAITFVRYSFALPWPLNHILCWRKKRAVAAKLDSLSWGDKTLGDVYDEVNNCCMALSDRLQTQPYFFGDRKTELDALVYGHVSAILMTPMAENKLREILAQFPTIIEHCRRIDSEYFHRMDN